MALTEILPGHTGPAMHALVVGVGAYRHLRGGSGVCSKEDWGLGQLPGAPVSARRFIDWLRADFHNPSAPLATVEHLLTGQVGAELGSEEPTTDAMRAAFGRWFARCTGHSDNIALLYFAGHGVRMGADTGLMLADFAAPGAPSLVSGAVHVEDTLLGMYGCAADRQCFIIDACRTTEEPLLQQMARPGVALATASATQVREIAQPILFASGAGQAAFQAVDAASPFTEALIRSLDGMGADDVSGGYRAGECVVSTASLLIGAQWAMRLKHLEKPFMSPQKAEQAGHGSFDLHRPRNPVRFPFVVGCKPAELNRHATMAVELAGATLAMQTGSARDLHLLVEPGTYHVVGTLDGREVRLERPITPPYRECRIEFPA